MRSLMVSDLANVWWEYVVQDGDGAMQDQSKSKGRLGRLPRQVLSL